MGAVCLGGRGALCDTGRKFLASFIFRTFSPPAGGFTPTGPLELWWAVLWNDGGHRTESFLPFRFCPHLLATPDAVGFSAAVQGPLVKGTMGLGTSSPASSLGVSKTDPEQTEEETNERISDC
jgi:hypothetical protein